MIKITFKEFFNSKEELGIVVKKIDDIKEIQRQCIKVTGKNKYHWVEDDCCMLEMLDKGIVLTSSGYWCYLEGCDIKTYLFCEVGEYRITKEGCERLLRAIFGTGYSFRYNQERRTTTLYKGKEKIRVVKCHEEDVFDWRIGLALCFSRSVFAKDKEVRYLKDKLSAKKFSEYVLMKVYAFDEDAYNDLKYRVKTAGECNEVHI